jgi:hypothetical protein
MKIVCPGFHVKMKWAAEQSNIALFLLLFIFKNENYEYRAKKNK